MHSHFFVSEKWLCVCQRNGFRLLPSGGDQWRTLTSTGTLGYDHASFPLSRISHLLAFREGSHSCTMLPYGDTSILRTPFWTMARDLTPRTIRFFVCPAVTICVSFALPATGKYATAYCGKGGTRRCCGQFTRAWCIEGTTPHSIDHHHMLSLLSGSCQFGRSTTCRLHLRPGYSTAVPAGPPPLANMSMSV